jgi:chemotaxis protein histidine kinase CheA
MSSATFTLPNYRLSKILRQPGGKTVAAAVKDAEEGVAALAEACLESIDEGLLEVDRYRKAFIESQNKAPAATALYDATNGIIGLAGAAGLDEMDHAAFSLCDLLDRMTRAGRWDADAVVVHVQALHLLRHPDVLGGAASVQMIVDGLKKVRDKVLAGVEEPGSEPENPPSS